MDALEKSNPLHVRSIGTTSGAWHTYCTRLTPSQRAQLREQAAYLRRTESSRFVLNTRSSFVHLSEPEIRRYAIAGSLLLVSAGISSLHSTRTPIVLALAGLGVVQWCIAVFLPYYYAEQERKILFSIVHACT